MKTLTLNPAYKEKGQQAAIHAKCKLEITGVCKDTGLIANWKDYCSANLEAGTGSLRWDPVQSPWRGLMQQLPCTASSAPSMRSPAEAGHGGPPQHEVGHSFLLCLPESRRQNICVGWHFSVVRGNSARCLH